MNIGFQLCNRCFVGTIRIVTGEPLSARAARSFEFVMNFRMFVCRGVFRKGVVASGEENCSKPA